MMMSLLKLRGGKCGMISVYLPGRTNACCLHVNLKCSVNVNTNSSAEIKLG